MKNLYVFKAVGEYFGGAMGVVAESPESAVEIAVADYAKKEPADTSPHSVVIDEKLRPSDRFGFKNHWWLSFTIPITDHGGDRVLFREYSDG